MLWRGDSARDSLDVETTLVLAFFHYLVLTHRLRAEDLAAPPTSLFPPFLDHSEPLVIRIDYKRRA